MATSMQPQASSRQSHATEARPTPNRIFNSLFAYKLSAALKAAIELDLFSAIAEGERTAEALALRTQASARGVRILCDFLSIEHFLEKHGSEYHLAPDSAAFLDRRSPMYLGGAAGFLASHEMIAHFNDVAGAVRRGGAAEGEETLQPENDFWISFARNMAGIAGFGAEMLAQLLARLDVPVNKVLDIAAGHGMYGVTLGRHHPKAKIVALDWRNVLEVAAENADHAGLGDRFDKIPGSAFDEEMGTDYDLVLLTNFLHHFDPPTNEVLLRKVHKALGPKGRVVILDFVPNPDRITPQEAAEFSLTMLVTTPKGDAYTFAEFESMLKNAGFATAELHPLPPTVQQVVIARKD
ncbi:MAG: class I SAM-dependent methyltransferase [Terriglobia bacterium]|jgi:2-polyprenyl-3-methyl-5-hydroxy-6-metoxy-1,4-benzoquinol methylase|nr:class I SAM-dependent methyltransferase [Terriglobia bacterium]